MLVKYYDRTKGETVGINVPTDVVAIYIPAQDGQPALVVNVNTDAVLVDTAEGKRVAMYEFGELLSKAGVAAEEEPPKLPEPPKLVVVPKPEPVRRGGVEELNAAVLAYNQAARHLGLMVLAGGIDKRVARGEPEDADDAISGVIYAAERLMLLGASLARKAESLADGRKDVKELTASSRVVEQRLPLLLNVAEVIDDLLDT